MGMQVPPQILVGKALEEARGSVCTKVRPRAGVVSIAKQEVDYRMTRPPKPGSLGFQGLLLWNILGMST